MKIKHFDISLQTLVALKDYLCNALRGENGQSIRRQAIKSLSELMTEFDTMSDCQEVVQTIYGQISTSIEEVTSISAREGSNIGLIGHIENLRGLFEGTYRQTQYMTLVKNFLSNPPVGSIRTRIEQLIDQGNYQSNNTFIDIVERAKFIKATLGLI